MDVGDVPSRSGHVVAMSALKGLDLQTGKIASGEGERLLRIERTKDIYAVTPKEADRFPLQRQSWKIRYFWEDPDCDDGRFWGDPPEPEERPFDPEEGGPPPLVADGSALGTPDVGKEGARSASRPPPRLPAARRRSSRGCRR